MSVDMQFSPPAELTELVEKHALVVCVIDDQFEPVLPVEVEDDHRAWLFDALENDGVETYRSPDEITSETIADMVKGGQGGERESGEATAAAVDRIRKNIRDDLDHLVALESYLTAMGIKVKCLYEEQDERLVDSAPECGLVLVDYVLGRGVDKVTAVERAVRVVKRLYRRAEQDGWSPIFVLMSNTPPTEDERQRLITESGLLGGLVHIVHKEVLWDRFRLCGRLYHYLHSAEIARAAQRLVKGLKDTITDQTRRFVAEVGQLIADDYVALLRLSIREDGQPLGDYLRWLFGEVARTELIERPFESEFENLDKIPFDREFPAPAPSPLLAQYLARALFRSMPDVKKHSHATSDQHLDIGFGDVFLSKSGQHHSVWLVISPECDLARARSDSGSEDAHTWSVILIPGKAGPLTAKKKLESTQILMHDDEKLVVDWDHNRSFSVPYEGLLDWKAKNAATRVGRMRGTFALRLQNQFASKLSRVGVPVPTPVMTQLSVTIASVEEGVRERCVDDGAWLYFDRDKKGYPQRKVRLTEEVISKARHALRESVDRRAAAKTCVDDDARWWGLRKPQNLQGSTCQPSKFKNFLSIAYGANACSTTTVTLYVKEPDPHPA